MSVDEGISPAKNEGKKRKRDDGSSPAFKAKKHKIDDDDDEEEEEEEEEEETYDNDNEDKAYQDRHDVTAQHLAQQAWAQATRVDGTVIVLHSGNHKLVCVRHRASQTLYVSDVIEPHKCVEPGYGKLHIGIYIAAIQDAIDRKQQALASDGGASISGNKDQDDQGSGSGGTGGGTGGPAHHGGKPKDRRSVEKSGGLQGLVGGKGPTDNELAIEKMIQEVNDHDVVLVYLRYDVYDSPIPALFVRSAPIISHPRCPTPPFSPRTTRPYRSEECMTIILTSEIGRGATGIVHRGTLVSNIRDDAIPMDIVVKLAFDVKQRKALKTEHDIYQRLKLKGVHRGIATVLGFFDDSEGGACALVMLYAGVPLSTDSQGNLTPSNCKSALSTLESIHSAGILHGDIRPENILINNLGVTMIDFGHSTKSDDRKAKDKEHARLRCLLGKSYWRDPNGP